MPSGSQPSLVFYCKQRIQRVQRCSMSNEGLSSTEQGAARHRGTLSCGSSQRASKPPQAPWWCIDLDAHLQPASNIPGLEASERNSLTAHTLFTTAVPFSEHSHGGQPGARHADTNKHPWVYFSSATLLPAQLYQVLSVPL